MQRHCAVDVRRQVLMDQRADGRWSRWVGKKCPPSPRESASIWVEAADFHPPEVQATLRLGGNRPNLASAFRLVSMYVTMPSIVTAR